MNPPCRLLFLRKLLRPSPHLAKPASSIVEHERLHEAGQVLSEIEVWVLLVAVVPLIWIGLVAGHLSRSMDAYSCRRAQQLLVRKRRDPDPLQQHFETREEHALTHPGGEHALLCSTFRAVRLKMRDQRESHHGSLCGRERRRQQAKFRLDDFGELG
ncbi:hypothetical protein HDK64DRAFT_273381 [Phyllosticta capitalensis]